MLPKNPCSIPAAGAESLLAAGVYVPDAERRARVYLVLVQGKGIHTRDRCWEMLGEAGATMLHPQAVCVLLCRRRDLLDVCAPNDNVWGRFFSGACNGWCGMSGVLHAF